MTEHTVPTPIKRALPKELEEEISDIPTKSYCPTGPPGDLDDNKKRWLVIGICLHSIISPALRRYVEPVISKLCYTLTLSSHIDKQVFPTHLKRYGPRVHLNYEPINSNKVKFGRQEKHYDYRVRNAVDLSKLFLQTHMAHYAAFDSTCDSSALLGLVINIDKFPPVVQGQANAIRSQIRNAWAHCTFPEWDSAKYLASFQLMENCINNLPLNAVDKKSIIGDLNQWKIDGINFLKGTTLGLELVNEIRHQTHVLAEYAQIVASETDAQFTRVQRELTELEKMLEKRINTLDRGLSDLKERVDQHDQTLKQQHTTLGKIADNVKDNQDKCQCYDMHQMEIQTWKGQNMRFVKTKVINNILRVLETEHCILISGISGIGKSSTARHIALKLQDEKQYNIIPCERPEDIKKCYRANIYQVFVFDDICGKHTASLTDIESWMKSEEKILQMLDKGKSKLLIACRTEVYKEEKFQVCMKEFTSSVFDLSTIYSTEDKLAIASAYLKETDVEPLKGNIDQIEFSPLMCYLYSKNEHFNLERFLESPYKSFSREWNKLKFLDEIKYCMLFLCVIYNGRLDITLFDVLDKDTQTTEKLEGIFECCKLPRNTPRLLIRDKLDACLGTYVIRNVAKSTAHGLPCGSTEEQMTRKLRHLHDKMFESSFIVDRDNSPEDSYRIIHDKMFDFLCCYFGKEMVPAILKYADGKIIYERTQLESLNKEHDDFTILISEEYERLYFKRIIEDLQNLRIHDELHNIQMNFDDYRSKFLSVLNDLDDNLVKQLISKKVDHCYDFWDLISETAFTVACLRGYKAVVQFFISKGANVNMDEEVLTPLYAACEGGHNAIILLLLENGADIDKTNGTGQTPLCGACQVGHLETVKLLLDSNAKVNKFEKEGQTPLSAACRGGHENIVKLLIDNGANVNEAEVESDTPLFAASERGHDEIVKLLLENGAIINNVNKEGQTPLHGACWLQHHNTVQLLVDTGADVNIVDFDGKGHYITRVWVGIMRPPSFCWIRELKLIQLAETAKCHSSRHVMEAMSR